MVLRALVPSDVDALFEIFSHPEVMRYWSHTPMTERSEAEELLEGIDDGFEAQALFEWGVARRQDDRVIGTCTLFHFDDHHHRAEVGYALARQHWRQGLMREVLSALFDYAFFTLNLGRLEADVDPRNTASSRLLEGLGFQREGYLRERWFVGGELQDALFYGLLRREWEARRGAG